VAIMLSISFPMLLLQSLVSTDVSVVVLLQFEKAGAALLVGALVGLERERSIPDSSKLFAGIRTFPLISLLGFLSMFLGDVVSIGLFIALASGFMALVLLSYVFSARDGYYGATSEIAAILVFVFGALIQREIYALAIASSVILTLFLTLKSPLQAFIGKVQEEDIYATLKFSIITAIILPILPDQTMGPLNVLNPRQIWYMVILIAGISFLGYLLVKLLGSEKGIPLTGLLGGLVSSTAVTLSFSQKSKTAPDLGRTFASAIVLACSIMYPRILVEVAVVNRPLFEFMWPFIAILTATGIGASIFLLFGSKKRRERDVPVELKNPFELMSAIKFGLIFAIILFVSKAAQLYWGNNGVYLAAGLAGLTDVDAITLSMANLAKSTISETTATTSILIAVVVNTIVKSGIAISLGAASLRRYTLPGFTAVLLAGISIIIWMLV